MSAARSNKRDTGDDGSSGPEVLEGEILSEDDGGGATGGKATPTAGATSRAPWILSAVLLAFVAGLFAAPWATEGLRGLGLLPPAESEGVGAAQIAALETRLANAEAVNERLTRRLEIQEVTLSELESTSGQEGAAGQELAARLDAAESRIAAMETKLDTAMSGLRAEIEAASSPAENAVTAEDLAALESRLAALETRAARAAARADDSALGIAMARLAEAVHGGATFEGALASLRARLPAQAPEVALRLEDALATLRPLAASGVPSLDSLRDELADAIPGALQAAPPAENSGWWSWLRGLVSVRRTGEQEGMDPDAVLARAEARLAAGDLAAAVALIEELGPEARAALADWLAAAHARLAATGAVDAMLDLFAGAEQAAETAPPESGQGG